MKFKFITYIQIILIAVSCALVRSQEVDLGVSVAYSIDEGQTWQTIQMKKHCYSLAEPEGEFHWALSLPEDFTKQGRVNETEIAFVLDPDSMMASASPTEVIYKRFHFGCGIHTHMEAKFEYPDNTTCNDNLYWWDTPYNTKPVCELGPDDYWNTQRGNIVWDEFTIPEVVCVYYSHIIVDDASGIYTWTPNATWTVHSQTQCPKPTTLESTPASSRSSLDFQSISTEVDVTTKSITSITRSVESTIVDASTSITSLSTGETKNTSTGSTESYFIYSQATITDDSSSSTDGRDKRVSTKSMTSMTTITDGSSLSADRRGKKVSTTSAASVALKTSISTVDSILNDEIYSVSKCKTIAKCEGKDKILCTAVCDCGAASTTRLETNPTTGHCSAVETKSILNNDDSPAGNVHPISNMERTSESNALSAQSKESGGAGVQADSITGGSYTNKHNDGTKLSTSANHESKSARTTMTNTISNSGAGNKNSAVLNIIRRGLMLLRP